MKDKVLVCLTTGMEDPERVQVAFLIATAGLTQGKEVVMWTTQEAVRLGLPGTMAGVPCKDCPPLERLLQQFVDGGGELWLCPICVNARDLQNAEMIPGTKIVGATPMWEWAGNNTTVFNY